MADMTTMPVSGNQDWGTILAQLIGGGASLYDAFGKGGTTDMGVARTAAGLADPFASQRPQYQEMLSHLLADPTSIRDEPGYKFGLDQGMDSIKGGANAIYQSNRAGAVLPELVKFGTGYADQAFNTRLGQLMQLAGVNAGSPGTAGLVYAKGGENQNQSIGSGIGNILGGLLGGANAGNLTSGIGGLLGKILNPGGGGGESSGPGASSGMPWGMGNRSSGSIDDAIGGTGGGGFNWDDIFGNTGNTGGGGDNWDALFGGGGYGGDFSTIDWDSLFGSGL